MQNIAKYAYKYIVYCIFTDLALVQDLIYIYQNTAYNFLKANNYIKRPDYNIFQPCIFRNFVTIMELLLKYRIHQS